MNTWLRLAVIASAVTVVACSTVPHDIGGQVDQSLTITRVRSEPALAQGQLVRWGGLVAHVQNKENQTWIEIVEKPLGSYGQPVDANVTNGRFIAIFDRFLDPMMFQKGREITVMGSLQPAIDGKIDEQPYKYVVVSASGYHLWQPRVDRHYDDVILLHRGWWDPWWYRPVYIHHHHHVGSTRPVVNTPTTNLPPHLPRPPRIATSNDEPRPRPPRASNDDDNRPSVVLPPRIITSNNSDDDEPAIKNDPRDKKRR